MRQAFLCVAILGLALLTLTPKQHLLGLYQFKPCK